MNALIGKQFDEAGRKRVLKAVSDNNVIDWDKLKCYGCGKKATRVHGSMVVPVCDDYPYCENKSQFEDSLTKPEEE